MSKLFEFQKDGVQFLLKTKRALLADEMGLGKTVQTIYACRACQARRVLVICPNTLKWTWEKEVEKWDPVKSTQVIDGNLKQRQEQYQKKVNFTIANFELLTYERGTKGQRSRPWSEDVKILEKIKWDVVIVDEASRVKNRKAQVTKATKKITKKVERVYFLTGTPLLNRVEELWSLMNILYPDVYTSYWRFVEEYCYVYFNGWGTQVGTGKPERMPELRRILDLFSLRRLKRDVLKTLPGVFPTRKVWIPLSGKQKKVYEEMATQMYTELSSEEKISAAVIIAQITRLKQIAIDYHLMSKEELQPLSGAKVEVLLELLEESPNEKIVVFSQFAQVIERLALLCRQLKLPYAKLVGGTRGEDREKEVTRFQTDRHCRLFLCSMKAGGMGITLTSSHIAVFLDKFWSPAINNQARERLDRIGQTEKVTTIELLASKTIEEGIEKMLVEKTQQFASLFKTYDPGLQEFEHAEREELLELLRYGL